MLAPRELLQEAGEPISHAYFPECAMISVVLPLNDGRIVEVVAIGMEGMAGYTLATDFGLSGPLQLVGVPGWHRRPVALPRWSTRSLPRTSAVARCTRCPSASPAGSSP